MLTHLDNDSREIKKAEENISNLTQSLKKTKERTNKLLNHATIFKLSKCKLCSEDLTLPSVHFLCGHSFHKVNTSIDKYSSRIRWTVSNWFSRGIPLFRELK